MMAAPNAIRFLLLFQAATFAVAALIHAGVIAAGTGYAHQKAAVAESVIATVLFAGAVLASLSPGWTRGAALAAQAFALLGTLVGVFTIIVGVGPRTAPDLAYHVAIVAILGWGLAATVRAPGREAVL